MIIDYDPDVALTHVGGGHWHITPYKGHFSRGTIAMTAKGHFRIIGEVHRTDTTQIGYLAKKA